MLMVASTVRRPAIPASIESPFCRATKNIPTRKNTALQRMTLALARSLRTVNISTSVIIAAVPIRISPAVA